jgi:hypothetical protein
MSGSEIPRLFVIVKKSSFDPALPKGGIAILSMVFGQGLWSADRQQSVDHVL